MMGGRGKFCTLSLGFGGIMKGFLKSCVREDRYEVSIRANSRVANVNLDMFQTLISAQMVTNVSG